MSHKKTLILIILCGVSSLWSQRTERKRKQKSATFEHKKTAEEIHTHKKAKPKEIKLETLTTAFERLKLSMPPSKRLASTREDEDSRGFSKKKRTTTEKDLKILQAQRFVDLLASQDCTQLLEKDKSNVVRTNDYTFRLVKTHLTKLTDLSKQFQDKSDEQLTTLLKILSTLEAIGFQHLPFS